MLRKKIAVCFAFIFYVSFLPSCGEPTTTLTEIWSSPDGSICAWFSDDEQPDSMGVSSDPAVMRVGKTSNGKEVFSFIRLPMRGSLLGNEIAGARLYLKVVEGQPPSALRIGLVNGYWNSSGTNLAGAKALFDSASAAAIAVKDEGQGWVSMDITNYVQDWIGGGIPNNGLVLLGGASAGYTAYAAYWDESSKDPPRMEVKGMLGRRDLNYGKFGYLRHPENKSDDAKIADNETANCLSYALRDTQVIGWKELGLDYGVMMELCRKGGEDSVADYCVQKIKDYVERNKAGLKISSFRQIADFDSGIDARNEYRIAFRVGAKLLDGADVLSDVAGNFDYHLWVQINTGQWAQKFMFSPTEIVPCTPPGVSPAKYPWDASLQWGQEKYHGFYTSKVVFFAVTKDADGFTRHKC